VSETPERVTYATLAGGQSDEFQRRWDIALERLRPALGGRHGHLIDGQERGLREAEGETFEDRSPIDRRGLLGRFPVGAAEDVDHAVRAARRGFAAWSGRHWSERAALLRRAAELVEQRGFDLSALVGLEVGKNRLEAMGDVTETADLIRYYCEQMERHAGFDRPMARLSSHEETRSILLPYGVWAVISPFNFPAALAGGPVSAALLAGNTVVLKPSPEAPLTALALYAAFRDAGVPAEALHLVYGSGEPTGAALVDHPEVDGLLFTGSKAVGMAILRRFARDYPKPCITEMGGKNPAVVMPSADLDAAAEGILRSAFGLQGQKCSACSRAYVHREVKDGFLEALVEKTRSLVIGDPTRHGVFLGPVIHERAYLAFQAAADAARRDGRILTGGEVRREGELGYGYFVAPTVVDALPPDHGLFREELFVPLLCVATVDSLEQAIEHANRTDYGLTAGLFSRDQDEIDAFLERVQAGVVYVNRRAGATTGAWPGVQPFGGWKGSGSSGKSSGGLYYVQQFLREQSRTVVR
jgi:1-pyrroline-5-carboxylate dehydrogenase